eukprot:PhF_6_TR6110/c0_g1_i2/m.9007
MEDPMSPASAAEILRVPHEGDFKQQNLSAWNPEYSPAHVTCTMIFVAVVLIPVGAMILIANSNTPEVIVDYGSVQNCKYDDNIFVDAGLGLRKPVGCKPIQIRFEITQTMSAPVLMYYKLTNFYQNYRRYAKSRSDRQMLGEDATMSDIEDCKPFHLVAGRKIYPCGAIAWSMFNDSLRLYRVTGATTQELICDSDLVATKNFCRKNGISWSGDRDIFAALTPAIAAKRGDTVTNLGVANHENIYVKNGWYENEPGHSIPHPNDEDFLVWRKTSSKPTFQKPFRYIDTDLTPGMYMLEVTQKFPTSEFGGGKAMVLSSEGWIGAKDTTTGVGFEVLGALCLAWALALLLLQGLKKRKNAATTMMNTPTH